jgi:serine/threonine-protein kinase
MRRILHRDVKPQNMLVNKQCIFKLCDFGISRQMRASQSIAMGTVQGTENYLPVCIEKYILYFKSYFIIK